MTREYVFRKAREYTEPDFGKKLDLLEFEIINDYSFPTDQKSKFIHTFSRLKSEMKSKWQTAKRTESCRAESLSEEAAEARNKHFRKFREQYARKFSRTDCNMDVLNRLLLVLDEK